MRDDEILTWRGVVGYLLTQTDEHERARVCVPAARIEHPRAAGLRRGVDLVLGQRADYRSELSDDLALRVQDMGDYYCAWLERRAIERETDGSAIFGDHSGNGSAAVLGAFIGVVLGGDRRAALVGAVLGTMTATRSSRRAPSHSE